MGGVGGGGGGMSTSMKGDGDRGVADCLEPYSGSEYFVVSRGDDGP